MPAPWPSAIPATRSRFDGGRGRCGRDAGHRRRHRHRRQPALSGTLAGAGTLTAGSYTLTGATVDANLGMGKLTQEGGTSTLNRVSAAERHRHRRPADAGPRAELDRLTAPATPSPSLPARPSLPGRQASPSVRRPSPNRWHAGQRQRPGGWLDHHTSTGTVGLGGNVTTTGAQTYAGAVTLAADVTAQSTGNADIAFNGSIDGAQALTVTTGWLDDPRRHRRRRHAAGQRGHQRWRHDHRGRQRHDDGRADVRGRHARRQCR